MQHAIGIFAFWNWFDPIRSWQESAEAQEQPQSIRLGEIVRGFVPVAHELLRILGGNERGLQPSESIVIKTEVCGDKSVFQDGCSSERSHCGSFRLCWGCLEHFSSSFLERARAVT